MGWVSDLRGKTVGLDTAPLICFIEAPPCCLRRCLMLLLVSWGGTAGLVRCEPDRNVTVINAGLGGHSTRDLLRRLKESVLAKKPDLLILMAGTNDILNHARSVPLNEYRENVATMVGQARESGCRVLLMTILPCHERYLLMRHPPEFYGKYAAAQGIAGKAGPNDLVARANDLLRGLAREKNIPLVDTHRIFLAIGNVGESADSMIRNEANSGARDGVHPTAQGYQVIATAVYQAILDHALPHDRVICLGDSITYGAHMAGAGTAQGNTYPGQLLRLLCSQAKQHEPRERR